MVSAHAQTRPGAHPTKKKMTRSRIQAHSSNGGPRNLRDEGTTHDSNPISNGDLDCCLPTKRRCHDPHYGRETGRESLSATGAGRARSVARVPGARRIPEPRSSTDQPGRRDDWFYARSDGPD